MFYFEKSNNCNTEPESKSWAQVSVYCKRFAKIVKDISGKTWVKLQNWVEIKLLNEENCHSWSEANLPYNNIKEYYEKMPSKKEETCCYLNNQKKIFKSHTSYSKTEVPSSNISDSFEGFKNPNANSVSSKKCRNIRRLTRHEVTPVNPSSSTDLFFKSISDTVKKMPPIAQAHLRLQIAHLVFSQELKLLQNKCNSESFVNKQS